MSNSLRPQGLQPARLLGLWDFPGKNIGVGCHFLLQGIFLTQGLNLSLLYFQAGSLTLSYQGGLWVAGRRQSIAGNNMTKILIPLVCMHVFLTTAIFKYL